MNEFNAPPQQDEAPHPLHEETRMADKPSLTPEPRGLRHALLERQYVAGLTAPWIAGIVLCAGVFGWYQFSTLAPSAPTVSQMAGLIEEDEGDVLPQYQPDPVPPRSAAAVDSGDARETIPAVREYAEANRTAITRLAAQVTQQSARLARLEAELKESQTQRYALSTRLATLELGRVNGAPDDRKKPSPTASMHLSTVQEGAAWIEWNGKTWAVREGDTLGKVAITRIDAPGRQVHTSGGIIR